MKQRNNITITLLLTAVTGLTLPMVSSCSIHRHNVKTSHPSSLMERTDSSAATTAKQRTRIRATETTTEFADTSVTVAGWTVQSSARQGVIALPGGGTVTFRHNSGDSVLITMPAKTVHFQFAKRTEREGEQDVTATTSSEQRVVKKTRMDDKLTLTDKTKDIAWRVPWWVWIGGAVVMACVYRFQKWIRSCV